MSKRYFKREEYQFSVGVGTTKEQPQLEEEINYLQLLKNIASTENLAES